MGREVKSFRLWALGLLGKYLLAACWVALLVIVVFRAADARAAKKYEAWQERFVNDYMELEQAKLSKLAAADEVDPYYEAVEREAEEIARVLYGIRHNSEEDLKTACWCVLNRVDSPDYPSTVEEVVGQPSQWMQYSADNPVLDGLHAIARDQVEIWHGGARRPVSSDFIYMNWTPARVVLRDRWEDGSSTNYWRWGQ